ncbi:MAG: SMC-Scp complex subunit ScpB [bacterium]|nr:MAG: SMC-Scp complex subunit ScpB [bacterium]
MARKKDAALIEALLFSSVKPLDLEILREVTGLDKNAISRILTDLAAACDEEGRGVVLREVAGGYQLRTRPEHADGIRRLHQARPRRRFSRSSLEALAIVAYRQPVTRAEVEHIRGVDCGAVLKTLLSQGMIRILGRKEVAGRPMLYGTTREFLEYFELRDLESLPTLEEITELEGEEPGAETRGSTSAEATVGRHEDAEEE